MKRFAVALATALVVAQPMLAAAQDEPLSWLERISSAAQKLNYSGVFVYQSGPISEISRITHFVDESGEHEHLEVLDGSPRQVIRSNDEVWCIFPDRKTVIADRSGAQRAFPARLPTALSRISETYEVRLGRVSRVAGFDAQVVILDPRDDLRYGHVFWADVESGLLLKAQIVDDGGATIEQFKFSDVRIGDVEPMDTKALLSRKDGDWKVVSAHGADVDLKDSGWRLAETLPGYRLESVVRRPLGREQRDVLHMVYSDGLASISVFIEPQEASAENGLGPLQSGAIHIYRREASGHLITALGEVPMKALERVADHMERVEQ